MSQYPKYGNNRPYRKKNIGSIVQDAIKGVSYSRNLEELRNNIDITIREVSDLAKSGKRGPFLEKSFCSPVQSPI